MIGILDSGNGGLSVLNEIVTLLPNESLLYIGDAAWCPYGEKSYIQIYQRVEKIINYLIDKGATLIVIACNSATIACIAQLRETFSLPIIGMEPGIKPAVKHSKTQAIGVFATRASLAGKKFHNLVSTYASEVKVYSQACPEFVTLVEQGILSGPATHDAIHRYTAPMIEQNVDTVVLGCSHYPFLKEEINLLYPDLYLIDTGVAIAKQVKRRYSPPLISPSHRSISFYTSGDASDKEGLIQTLCPRVKFPSIQQIDF